MRSRVLFFLLALAVARAVQAPCIIKQDADEAPSPGALVRDPVQKEVVVKDAPFCGPAKDKHVTVIHKDEHPTPDPPPGKAVIYFLARGSGTWLGRQYKVALDGKWVAVLTKNTYAYLEANPGLLKLCLSDLLHSTSVSGLLFLTVEAGRSYYLSVPANSAWRKYEPHLAEISENQGREMLGKCEFATFELKANR